MENYNYLEQVTEDVKNAILERMDEWDFDNRDELEQVANDELWNDDSVTGNASGSYYCNTWYAEEYLCHNMDELADACDEFGQDIGEAVKQGAEYCDVTVRCYLLAQAITTALDELEEEQRVVYPDDDAE